MLIDVTDLLIDPDFCDDYTIQRVTQGVDNFGRAAETIIELPGYGSVQPVSNRTLELFPDLERVTGMMQVYTRDTLNAATVTTSPDRIVWQGSTYRVQAMSEWPHSGGGFVVAILSLYDLLAPAPT